jgi:hypothetical protein
MTIQEIQEKQKEYNKKLAAISGNSSLYDVVYSMKQAIDNEYQERLYLDTYKENKEQLETVTEIGTISSDLTKPDYQDEAQKIVHDLASFYANKDSSDDQNS